MHCRRQTLCQPDVGLNASLGLEESPVRLEYGAVLVRQPVAGKTFVQFRASQEFMAESMNTARLQRTLNHTGPDWTGVDRPSHVQQVFAGVLLQFPPQSEGSAQQWDVARMFEVRQPDDSGEAVRRSTIVPGLELLDGDHRKPALCQVVRDRASHAANPKYGNVIRLCHGDSPGPL